MGCCIQSSLAKILAEFEMTLERDVLQPLNKLSEVDLDTLLASLPCPTLPSPSPSLLHSLWPLSAPGRASHYPEAQEDAPEVDFGLEYNQEPVWGTLQLRGQGIWGTLSSQAGGERKMSALWNGFLRAGGKVEEALWECPACPPLQMPPALG